MKHQDIYSLIKSEETNFRLPVAIAENYEWNMYQHIRTGVLRKSGKFLDGANDGNRPYKNIVRPILNLQYRAEGFDVKDIILFIEDSYKYFKSFLVRKFHDKWARENHIDTFIDQLVESFVDYGGALVKNVKGARPEVVPLPRLAFCDQTDILSGPICEKHFYSPEELQAMSGKWDKDNVDKVIVLATPDKSVALAQKAQTPGKYVEVYEVHGVFPQYWLYDRDKEGNYSGSYYAEATPEMELTRQVHICTFYQDERGEKQGIWLYKAPESKIPYKLVLRDEIYGRALGLGGVEELEDPQVWVNYDMIRMQNLLDAASKILLSTDDPTVAAKHPSGLKNLDNLEIIERQQGTTLGQVDTFPRNLALFDRSVAEWEAHARQMGAATESILGETPSSGTPFKLQELITAESHSLHEYRKGKLAVFVDEIYQDWILPHIAREITQGKTFLAELELDELQQVADNLVICQTNDYLKEKILNGETIDPQEVELKKQEIRQQFMSGGNQKFIEILKDELRDVPLAIRISIKGKQKDLAAQTDKLVNILRTVAANPAILQNPAMAKLFNSILESSGLEPLDFSGFVQPSNQSPQPNPTTQPLQALAPKVNNPIPQPV